MASFAVEAAPGCGRRGARRGPASSAAAALSASLSASLSGSLASSLALASALGLALAACSFDEVRPAVDQPTPRAFSHAGEAGGGAGASGAAKPLPVDWPKLFGSPGARAARRRHGARQFRRGRSGRAHPPGRRPDGDLLGAAVPPGELVQHRRAQLHADDDPRRGSLGARRLRRHDRHQQLQPGPHGELRARPVGPQPLRQPGRGAQRGGDALRPRHAGADLGGLGRQQLLLAAVGAGPAEDRRPEPQGGALRAGGHQGPAVRRHRHGAGGGPAAERGRPAAGELPAAAAAAPAGQDRHRAADGPRARGPRHPGRQPRRAQGPDDPGRPARPGGAPPARRGGGGRQPGLGRRLGAGRAGRAVPDRVADRLGRRREHGAAHAAVAGGRLRLLRLGARLAAARRRRAEGRTRPAARPRPRAAAGLPAARWCSPSSTSRTP